MTIEEFDGWFRTRYRRTTSALTATAMVLADFIGVMVSFGAGFLVVKLFYIWKGNWGGINFKSFVTYWPYLPIFVIIFWIMRLYPGAALAPAEETKGFAIASFLAHVGINVSRYIQYDKIDSILAAFIFSFVFSPVILMICRDIMHSLIAQIKMKGIPAVVFGAGNTGRLVVDRMVKAKKVGYEPVLILDDDPDTGDSYRNIPIIHDTLLGPELVKRYKIKMAIVAMPNLDQAKMTRMINNSVSAFRYNVLIPDFFSINNIWMQVRDFNGILGFATSHRLKMYWNLAIKRFLDLLLVSLGGLIILPFLLLIALAIKLSSSGPVLYGHKRLGLNGKYFRAFKFRSMILDAEKKLESVLDADPRLREEWKASHKLKDDPRVTTVGRFLRRTSFDEFPQLINILKGEMSLVGPRPVTDPEIEKYGENSRRVLSVKPGLTGLWQVSGRSDTDYAERVSYDLYYIQSWSVWLDLWILYRTPGAILKGKGAY
ncbi:MAG: undecaprenyl-phosphate galactose phosphotransferase WbaP [Treponema sp.]|jgi:Undecaprenyl-phosphate galactose phosphotransferase WbaP|nr:undecaprenyl-phosphate galactose phosphotransferase WbaP [Treponema sp.]